MTAHRQTLLAKLAPKFGPQTENLAVDALGHILSESERPDLAGFDRDGHERVLIEAKFWAGLTDNQPVAYLERLLANTPSALLFVAPAARLETLWNELRRTVAKSPSGIMLARFFETAGLRSATAGGRRHLLLTSWQALLDRMATEAAAASDSDTEKDIGQLRGLAAQQDDDAFRPLRHEELGLEFPRRMLGLRRLIDDATECAIRSRFANVRGLQVTPQAWGYGRYVRLASSTPWFGISFHHWARTQETPLWLWFQGRYLRGKTRRALEQLRQRHQPELFESDGDLVVPVELQVGREYEAVLEAVVKRLKEVADLIRAPGKSR